MTLGKVALHEVPKSIGWDTLCISRVPNAESFTGRRSLDHHQVSG